MQLCARAREDLTALRRFGQDDQIADSIKDEPVEEEAGLDRSEALERVQLVVDWAEESLA